MNHLVEFMKVGHHFYLRNENRILELMNFEEGLTVCIVKYMDNKEKEMMPVIYLVIQGTDIGSNTEMVELLYGKHKVSAQEAYLSTRATIGDIRARGIIKNFTP